MPYPIYGFKHETELTSVYGLEISVFQINWKIRKRKKKHCIATGKKAFSSDRMRLSNRTARFGKAIYISLQNEFCSGALSARRSGRTLRVRGQNNMCSYIFIFKYKLYLEKTLFTEQRKSPQFLTAQAVRQMFTKSLSLGACAFLIFVVLFLEKKVYV